MRVDEKERKEAPTSSGLLFFFYAYGPRRPLNG